MRIHGLVAENIKRLKVVKLELNNGVVQITGRNEQGKSSLIDAIWMCLGGKAAQPEQPVRQGARSGSIELNLGEMVAVREFKAGGSQSLKVTMANGMPVSSPQTVLNSLIPRLAFDPLAFARARPAEQIQILKEAIGVDTTDVDKRIQELETERLTVGRTRDCLGKPMPIPAEQRVQKVDPSELMAQLDTRAEYERQKSNSEMMTRAQLDDINERRLRKAKLEKQLEELTAEIERFETQYATMQEEAKQIESHAGASIDAAAVRTAMSKARETNETADRQAAADERAEQYIRLNDEYEGLTIALNEAKEERTHLMSSSKLPVEGLVFDDGRLLLNGVPFSQCSTRQQIMLSAMVGMALAPALRVMFIREGGLLDSSAYEELHKLAEQHDFQILVERVTDGGPIGIVIEDGRVLGTHTTEGGAA